MKTEDEFKKEFGKNLSKARKACGYTQLQLAEALNYTDKAVSKWERGESVPDTYTVMRISEVLGISTSLLTGEEEIKPVEMRIQKKKKNPVSVFVPIISSITVFFIASVLFMVFKMIPATVDFAPYIYLVALPAMFIELVVFSFIWWNRPAQFVCLSCLIWSICGCAYGLVQFFTELYDFRYIFISSAFLQIICIIVFLFVKFIVKYKKHG